MIYLYTGTPGSGKSLDVSRIILNNIRQKKPCIINFDFNLPKRLVKNSGYLNIMYDSEITPSFLINFSKKYFENHKFKEGTILLVIDESQILFNAREWNKKGRDDWLKFFTNHRHFGFDIVLVCQFDLMIDKQIRSLVEYEIIHRKVSNFGIKGYLLMLFMLSPNLFCRIKVWYPMKEKIDHNFYRFSRKYSSVYNSYDSVFVDNE